MQRFVRNKSGPNLLSLELTLVMNNKLFVGNLPWSVDDTKLGELFAEFGEMTSARVITDRETGRSRGFGFVEFATDAEASAAMEAMDGKEVDERPINVSIAKPSER